MDRRLVGRTANRSGFTGFGRLRADGRTGHWNRLSTMDFGVRCTLWPCSFGSGRHRPHTSDPYSAWGLRHLGGGRPQLLHDYKLQTSGQHQPKFERVHSTDGLQANDPGVEKPSVTFSGSVLAVSESRVTFLPLRLAVTTRF